MVNLRIAEQLQHLRKQKGLTQEELSNVFNVTNQTVSKWESGQSCPDISLLPEIAEYFKVSIDTLLGYKPTSTLNDIYLLMKSMFLEINSEESIDVAYQIMSLCSNEIVKNRNSEETSKAILEGKRNKSAGLLQGDGGVITSADNSLFISTFKDYPSFNYNTIKAVNKFLTSINDRNTLVVMYTLFEMNLNDFKASYTIEEIVEKTKLTKDEIWKALDNLDIAIFKNSKGEDTYTLAYSHIVPMLNLLLIGSKYFPNNGIHYSKFQKAISNTK